MQLSEEKTYRTRDGSRTGIRVRRGSSSNTFLRVDARYELPWSWNEDGSWTGNPDCDQFALVEEQPADRPFSYDACPVGEDGRRRAVTRDGREVVLLCDDAPGSFPIIGWYGSEKEIYRWGKNGGCSYKQTELDLFIPPPPKRVVWVNRYDSQAAADAADSGSGRWVARLGGRAYPIEIDP